MRSVWVVVLAILLVVAVGLVLWLPSPWNLAVGALVLLKLSAGFALIRGLGQFGGKRRTP